MKGIHSLSRPATWAPAWSQEPQLSSWLPQALAGLARHEPQAFGRYLAPALAGLGSSLFELHSLLDGPPGQALAEVCHRLYTGGNLGLALTQRWAGTFDRQLITCNHKYADLAGRPREELLRIGDMRHLQHRLHDKETSAERQAMLEYQLPYGGFACWRRPDQKPNTSEFRAIPLQLGERLMVADFYRGLTQ